MAVALAATLVTPRAFADPILEFDDAASFGGTITYTGDPGAPLVGTDIYIDTLIASGTVPSGSYAIIGGDLDFTTGPNLSESSTLDTFAGGGSFVLSGTVIRADLSVVASGVLLTGSFSGISVVIGQGGGKGLFSAVGTDVKNPDLLAEFGIAPATPFEFANTEIGFASAGLQPDGGFVASVIDADVTNTGHDIG
jgi:hypothetical protein